MLWDSIRIEDHVLPDFAHLGNEVLTHKEATWAGYQDLPEESRSEFTPVVTHADIQRAVSQFPTLFRVTKCNASLLIKAVHKVVQQHRSRIVGFLEKQP